MVLVFDFKGYRLELRMHIKHRYNRLEKIVKLFKNLWILIANFWDLPGSLVADTFMYLDNALFFN